MPEDSVPVKITYVKHDENCLPATALLLPAKFAGALHQPRQRHRFRPTAARNRLMSELSLRGHRLWIIPGLR